MKICISGTPGTGKSTVSKMIGIRVVNLNDFSEERGCTRGYDRKRRAKIVDVECLNVQLKSLEGDVILEGHYAHLLDCDITIVLRTSPKVLRKRLEERNYSEEKIRENLEAEALGLITEEAVSRNGNVYEIDTTSIDEEETAEMIRRIILGKGDDLRAGHIDYSEEILEWY